MGRNRYIDNVKGYLCSLCVIRARFFVTGTLEILQQSDMFTERIAVSILQSGKEMFTALASF